MEGITISQEEMNRLIANQKENALLMKMIVVCLDDNNRDSFTEEEIRMIYKLEEDTPAPRNIVICGGDSASKNIDNVAGSSKLMYKSIKGYKQYEKLPNEKLEEANRLLMSAAHLSVNEHLAEHNECLQKAASIFKEIRSSIKEELVRTIPNQEFYISPEAKEKYETRRKEFLQSILSSKASGNPIKFPILESIDAGSVTVEDLLNVYPTRYVGTTVQAHIFDKAQWIAKSILENAKPGEPQERVKITHLHSIIDGIVPFGLTVVDENGNPSCTEAIPYENDKGDLQDKLIAELQKCKTNDYNSIQIAANALGCFNELAVKSGYKDLSAVIQELISNL